MIIASWNVNGIRAVHTKGHFMPFIDRYQPDILCLQETKAEQHQSPLDLPQYTELWNSAKNKKGYSGTAIFTKTPPLSVRYDIPEDLAREYGFDQDPYGSPNIEGRVIAAEFKEVFVVSVYTPNAKDDLSRLPLRHVRWDPAFLAYMERLNEQKSVIFCGDLNVAHTEDDLARPQENVGNKGFTDEERAGMDAYVKAGFVDTFRLFTQGNGHYSWWSHWARARERNIGWRIDYIMVSAALAKSVISASILPDVLGSDHCPVLIETTLSTGI